MKKNDILSLLYQLLFPVLLIVLGAVLLINPDSASVLVAKILGWVLLLAGIGCGVAALTTHTGTAGKVLSALVCLALGSWLLKNPLNLAAGIGRFIGILLLVRGIRDILNSSRREGKILALVTAVAGVVLILLPMTTSRLVFSLCGLVVLIIGIVMLLDRLRDRKRLNEPEDPNIIDAL